MENLFLLFIASLGVLLVIIIIMIESHNKNDYWTGIVEDKQVTFYHYKNNKKAHYSLVFLKDSGKRIRYSVNSYQYHHFNVGDKVIKVRAKYLPSIMDNNMNINTKNLIEDDCVF